MEATHETIQERPSWLDRPLQAVLTLNFETVLFGLILFAAVFTRFYDLGTRVMSHDESLHTYYSWRLYKGQGFAHTPLMHGPLQFHLIALSYFLFGDSDFSARIFAVLTSIATIAMMWKFRPYLGRAGAIVAAGLMVISPYMLYYGRYVRNEAYVGLFGVVMIWAILRYLDSGENKYLYYLTAATVLHFTAKETSFIYTAQALLFLGLLFERDITSKPWPIKDQRSAFLVTLLVAMLLFGASYFFVFGRGVLGPLSATDVAPPANPEEVVAPTIIPTARLGIQLGIGGGVFLIASMYFLAVGYGLDNLKKERALSIIILLSTLILPHLAAFIHRVIGWDPLDYSWPTGILRTTLLVLPLILVGAVVGLWWNRRQWLINAAIFYAIFTVFYTTIFTNGNGFFSGLVGSLGYWLEQQGVKRGNQPWYYYLFLQVPVYEYLPLLGSFLALYLYPRRWLFGGVIGGLVAALAGYHLSFIVLGGLFPPETASTFSLLAYVLIIAAGIWIGAMAGGRSGIGLNILAGFAGAAGGYWLGASFGENFTFPSLVPYLVALMGAALGVYLADRFRVPALPEPAEDEDIASPVSTPAGENLSLPLLGFWTVTSFAAYTIAGEKMPWLTYHIALPMILLSGWGIGQIIEGIDWQKFARNRGLLLLGLLLILFIAVIGLVTALLGPNPPFQGPELNQLQATTSFAFSALVAGLSLAGILWMMRSWEKLQIRNVGILAFFGLLAFLTTRTAVNSSFIRFDQATEYLVYAHSAGPVKEVLQQVEEISRRVSGDLSMGVAYDDDVSWPFTWYFRNFPNHRYYGGNPTRDLRDVPIIVVGDNNFSKIEPVVGQAYYRFDYIRMWWPDQDYFNLSWDRIRNAIANPEMRAAIFNIWLNRDYSYYGMLTNKDMSLGNWNPSDRMRMYVRKDVAANIWEYGIAPSPETLAADPYEGKDVTLLPDRTLGGSGSDPGQFNAPRGLAVAADGTLYVADSRNHRIQHLTTEGEVLASWGSFADATSGDAPGGTFNEPWDLAVAADGSVFVADTWNHRIQKFSADGKFITMWGFFGTAETPDAFWGPRSVVVDAQDRLFVTDTGNKRVVVFDLDGNYITQFGEQGFAPGQFDEPVGLALDGESRLYVADTWNQRIQVLSPNGEPIRNWEIFGWFSDTLENKPYLAVDPENGRLFVADPEGYRVLEFTTEGEFLRYWGDYSTQSNGFGLVSGMAVDPEGGLWVSDGFNNRLLHFTFP